MAKGNDGNYLQHAIEVAAATQLASSGPAKRLHIALAHGMAPFEPCEPPKGGRARDLFKRAINKSYGPRQSAEPPIVGAYRAAGATFKHYPNSAELLRTVVPKGYLSGGITEVDGPRFAALAESWIDSDVITKHASWRSEVGPGGVLACPASLDAPWLFSLDPMTYKEKGAADDDNVYRSDLARLASSVGYFAKSGKPGLVSIFAYAIEPDTAKLFRQFAGDLAQAIGAALVCGSVAHYRTKRNVAALLCSGWSLSSGSFAAGINVGC